MQDDGPMEDPPAPPSSTTSPEHAQFTHFHQPHNSEPSLPPSPPTSMDDTLDIQQIEQHQQHQQHVSYGPNISRPHPSQYDHKYDHNLSSQNTSPSVSQSPNQLPPQQKQHHVHQNQQHSQQLPGARHDQPQPSHSFARSREPSTISIHSVSRDLHSPNHVSQFHPYHRPVEQQQPQPAHQQPPQPTNSNHQPPQPYPHSHQQSYHQPVAPLHHPIPTSAPASALHPSPVGPSLLPDRRTLLQERWVRMENLFHNVRRQANEFEFAEGSVSALEMLLIRMYLELPNNGQSASLHGPVNQHPPGRDQNHNMLPQ
ncbi:hypothetical protein M408DRAFT_86599 [Serendipita vermifera MAFF 305830]|uniref:Uncharacterized protein n=1 Tax=Serendipita vermifera MAFF 305830 TaxID=933852 RepID=A0A0C2XYD2_SERVB|nr:hypothetical protein M408DRAFT_86599 [Serendipita vermifera MAFF 305830]